ncbi:hypothetical protein ACFL17_10200 [Pseudomonadota bacterium]
MSMPNALEKYLLRRLTEHRQVRAGEKKRRFYGSWIKNKTVLNLVFRQ